MLFKRKLTLLLLSSSSAFYCQSTKLLVNRAELGSWEWDMVMELVLLFPFACRFKLWSYSWYMGDKKWSWVWHSSLFWTQPSIPWGTVGMKTQCSSSWIKNLECKFVKLQNRVLEFKVMLAPCPVIALWEPAKYVMNCHEMRLLMGCWWGFDWSFWLELWIISSSRELFQNKDSKPGD